MAKSNVSMNRLKNLKFGWFFLFASVGVCSSKTVHFYADLGGGYNSLAMTQQLYVYATNE